MKVRGADLKAFYEAWPLGEGWAHEDGEVEDLDRLDPVALYDIDEALGGLWWQGSYDECPEVVEIGGIRLKVDTMTFARIYKAWQKSHTTTRLVVDVPNEAVEAVRAFVAQQKGKVL